MIAAPVPSARLSRLLPTEAAVTTIDSGGGIADDAPIASGVTLSRGDAQVPAIADHVPCQTLGLLQPLAGARTAQAAGDWQRLPFREIGDTHWRIVGFGATATPLFWTRPAIRITTHRAGSGSGVQARDDIGFLDNLRRYARCSRLPGRVITRPATSIQARSI